jgi:hypothetical protein
LLRLGALFDADDGGENSEGKKQKPHERKAHGKKLTNLGLLPNIACRRAKLPS